MIKNLWDKVSFYCTNGHDEPIKLVVQQGDTPFYACPRYFQFDNEHPEGHLKGEAACHNRISFRDAERIVTKLSDKIESDMAEDDVSDYKNCRITIGNTISAVVLKYTSKEIRIGVVNRLAITK